MLQNIFLISDLLSTPCSGKRMDYPELKRAPRQQYERFKPDNVLIEDEASGTLEEMSQAQIALSTAY